jgi:hypothetical protein
MAEDGNQLIVEPPTAVVAIPARWKARARVAAPFVAAAVAAVVLTWASIFIERHGPQFIILRETCGANGKDYCFDPVLKGGFPRAYLFDTPITPGTLRLSEDSFRRGAFWLDVLLYFATLVLGREAVARFRARRRRSPDAPAPTSVEELPTVKSPSPREELPTVKSPSPREELPTVKSPSPREEPRPEQDQIVVERTAHQAVAKSRPIAEVQSSNEIVIAPGDRDLAKEALLAELEFSRSLIRTYREFQIRAVGFTVALYAVVLALIGSAIDSTKLLDVASYVTALLPIPTAVLVLAFAVMEIRIRRASRHNQHTISPKLEALREPGSTPPLLEWEANSSRWLTRFERLMTSSTIFVVVMTLPALGGAAWHLLAGAIPRAISHPLAAALNGIVLLAAALLATWPSVAHDSRESSITDADRRPVKRTSSRSLARSRS